MRSLSDKVIERLMARCTVGAAAALAEQCNSYDEHYALLVATEKRCAPGADFTRAELGFTDAAGPGFWVVVTPGNPRTIQVPALDASHAALGPSAGSLAAVRQLLIIDRETTYAAHLTEGVMALSNDETSDLLGVQEVAGTTLRYAGYAGE